MINDEALEQRRHAAHHEAAHVVVAYWFGWWVDDHGVMIHNYGIKDVPCGGRDYTGLKLPRWANTTQAQVCVNNAGWLAEMMLTPTLPHREDRDLLEDLGEIRQELNKD